MTSRHSPLLALIACVVLTASGCFGGDDPEPSTPTSAAAPATARSAAPPDDQEEPPPAGTQDAGWQAEAEDAVSVVDGFWRAHWNDHFSGVYEAPTVVGAYIADDADAPDCAGEPAAAFNAFYCPPEDFIAWDVQLMSAGYEEGDAWIYLVIAHEWAHAVQNRVEGLSVDAAELQADCLAGATLFGADDLQFEPGDTDELAQALTALADTTPWTSSQDHGDADERVTAFSSGGSDGVPACLPA
ncbi:hypothetical protein [Streptomyces sp. NBC_01304]|uniref:hypothetical protein n=1 Tax=Streptomyces sp. NBC_01304 TaxID=2903818 RepID=UPI002E12CC05|nr:neutral zinc metallopeptidase [Streptomyces sp. NBC_01304]